MLGPWTNPGWLNALASVIVGVLVMLSMILGAVTLFPDIDVGWLTAVLGGLLVGGLGVLGAVRLRGRRQRQAEVPDIGEVEEIDRLTWQMPPLEELPRPIWSLARKAAVLTLRGYLVVAMVLVLAKVVQLALGSGLHA